MGECSSDLPPPQPVAAALLRSAPSPCDFGEAEGGPKVVGGQICRTPQAEHLHAASSRSAFDVVDECPAVQDQPGVLADPGHKQLGHLAAVSPHGVADEIVVIVHGYDLVVSVTCVVDRSWQPADALPVDRVSVVADLKGLDLLADLQLLDVRSADTLVRLCVHEGFSFSSLKLKDREAINRLLQAQASASLRLTLESGKSGQIEMFGTPE